MDKFYEVLYMNSTNAYCVSIGTATPNPIKVSLCITRPDALAAASLL
jgi:hypothetical protein